MHEVFQIKNWNKKFVQVQKFGKFELIKIKKRHMLVHIDVYGKEYVNNVSLKLNSQNFNVKL